MNVSEETHRSGIYDDGQDRKEEETNSNGVTLTWRDVSVYAMDRGRRNVCKQLIYNVRGAARPGDLTAIIGARYSCSSCGAKWSICPENGAGKSSLMTALAFRNGPEVLVHGDVRANGAPVDSPYMMANSGYMHQEDIFVETMTVIEHLWFMARMKLDGGTRMSEIRDKIDRLLQNVGLNGRRDVRIGNGVDDKVLSGGEKKRLAFATELLIDPKILFLDEPTTGQDSHSANSLISQLKCFATTGRNTVLCTIHQPSSAIFDSFDRVILIADGRLAFAGRTKQAVQFFQSQGYVCPRNYNPADFLIATVAAGSEAENDGKGAARKLCDFFSTTDHSSEVDRILDKEIPSDQSSRSTERIFIDGKSIWKRQRYCSRLYWLIYRDFLQVLRDPSLQLIRILQKVKYGASARQKLLRQNEDSSVLDSACVALTRTRLCSISARDGLADWVQAVQTGLEILQSVAIIAGLCFVGALNPDQLGIQATQGVVFILVSENAFFPMYATLALLPQQLPLLRREYRAGMYPIHLYYVARMLSLVPGLIVEPLLFTSIIYWLAGLRNTMEAFGLTLLVILLTINVSTACGESLDDENAPESNYSAWTRYFRATIGFTYSRRSNFEGCAPSARPSISLVPYSLFVAPRRTRAATVSTRRNSAVASCFFSTAFESVPLAMAYLVPFDYILMISMGPFLKLGSLPIYIRWIKYISWLLYSNEALTILQWSGVRNISCETLDPELPCITDGLGVLNRYDFDESNFWRDMLLMVLMYLVFHVLGYLCLWNRCRLK